MYLKLAQSMKEIITLRIYKWAWWKSEWENVGGEKSCGTKYYVKSTYQRALNHDEASFCSANFPDVFIFERFLSLSSSISS